MNRIVRIKALMIKEIHAIWRDPKSRIVLIAPLTIQLFIFSFAATLEVKNVALGIYNLDGGKHGYELVQRFAGSKTFSRMIFLNSPEEAVKAADEQKVLAVVSIPQDFSRRIEAGEQGKIQVLLDGRKSNASQIVMGYINSVINQYSDELREKAGAAPLPAVVSGRSFYNENLIYMWFIVPSLMGILTMVGTLVLTSLSVAREREQGTFDQLLVSPLMPWEILIGKTVPPMAVGMTQGSFILLFSYFIFGIPFRGSVLMLYAALFVFALSVTGIGLFISSLAKTQQQAILGAFVFMVPAIALSGFASPFENMPPWLQTLMQVNPLKHFLIVLKGIYLKDMSAANVLANTLPVAAIAAACLAFAGALFRRRLE
ncbi:ABC transporter permease [Geovibrio thiophilus]|nr:ABC transporter permease [Geovibrio thiophilus]